MSGRITQGADITADVAERCDVCIIGSGAGGAVLAAGLVEQGLDVVMLEAGGYHTRRDFDLNEGRAYPMLYQERGGRATKDLAINILQGRSVGGSTTVNWTTCFRTPERILQHWETTHGIEGLDAQTLDPHFTAIEERLNINAWPEQAANPNNRSLLDGARSLGWEAGPLRRNVRGCANSGFCGVGCPVDGKQAMHVTYIPDAIAGGMRLYSDVEVRNIETDGARAVTVRGRVMQRGRSVDAPYTVTVRPKVVAVCGGAINSPALLLRSGLDFNGRTGKRTFIHPVIAVLGKYAQKIEPYYGAPQSIGSHQFFDRGEKMGFFLEASPMQPMLASTAFTNFGAEMERYMRDLPYVSGLLALHVDGLLPGDEGGTVTALPDGRIDLDYPITPRLQEAMRASHEVLMRVHLAAGAQYTGTLHQKSLFAYTEDDLRALDRLEYGAHKHAMFSAHQMGGCSMGPDPETAVVRPDHRHHRIENLFVVDGSVLPTSLGVNPSQTIYSLAHRARHFVGTSV
ncbi:MAG: GMC family oxidoreductase [Myxococcota bacterium]